MAKRRTRKFLGVNIASLATLCVVCICLGAIFDATNLVPDTSMPIANNESSVVVDQGHSLVQPTQVQRVEIIPTETETTIPTATKVYDLFPLVAKNFSPINECVPTHTERTEAEVVSITDGDTIQVDIEGTLLKVRYIGIDTPESTNSVDTFGAEASNKNRELVAGKTVTLVKDVSETDQYSRLLRYVIADGVFVNLELVKQGYATAVSYPPDTSCYETFLVAEGVARQNLIGFWGIPTEQPTAVPVPTRRPKVKPTRTPKTRGGSNLLPGGCDPSYPDVCIPSPPPDLDCGQISFSNFRVIGSDPHRFDGDNDGIGCER